MSEHWTRSNDRGSGECLADSSLTSGLGTIELGCRGRRSVEVRYVNQPRDANARGDLGNAPSTFNMYIVKGEIPFAKRYHSQRLHWHEKNRYEGEMTYLVS
jgi:hypothetical protein